MRRLFLLLSLASLSLLLSPLEGCSKPTCRDVDQDGFGNECAAGNDCDDNDPTRNVDCSGPAVDCSETPFSAGCPCLYGAQIDCFEGDPSLAGVGQCIGGQQLCVGSGRWSACSGSVQPTFETCNGLDDNCDGVIDDGVRSPCGGCDSTCIGGVWGEAEAPFVGDSPLALTASGELTLATTKADANTLWITNTGEDTVSRIDTATALEVARYDSGGSQPTRVAIDDLGDVWIANRAFDGQSTVTKIASSDERCIDRDASGIDTSSGPNDVRPRGQDECVVLTFPVGGQNAVARALAIDGGSGLDDAPGRLWVGLQNEARVVQLDPATGAVLRSVETPDFAPFDAAFDPWGVLWMIDRDGYLGRVIHQGDAIEFRIFDVPQTCWQLDAMAIDPDGRITLSGFYCDQVWLFDPRTERFSVLRDVVSTRGVAANAEHSVVVHTYGELSLITRDPLRLRQTYSLASDSYEPIETVGAAFDNLGHVWTVSTLGGRANAGVATRFDLSLEAVTAQVPVGRLPYAAGDLTGQARTQVVANEGVATHVFEGCMSGFPTLWSAVHVQWLPGVGSRLGVRARHAQSAALLQTTSFVDLGDAPFDATPLPLSFPDGGLLEVELTLTAGSRLGAPRVTRVGVEWNCGGVE